MYTCVQSYEMFHFKQRHFHKNSKYSWIHGIQQSVQQRRPWGVREGQEVRKLVCTDTSKNWISEFFQQTFVDTWTFIFKITAYFSGNNFNFPIFRIIKWKNLCNVQSYISYIGATIIYIYYVLFAFSWCSQILFLFFLKSIQTNLSSCSIWYFKINILVYNMYLENLLKWQKHPQLPTKSLNSLCKCT